MEGNPRVTKVLNTAQAQMFSKTGAKQRGIIIFSTEKNNLTLCLKFSSWWFELIFLNPYILGEIIQFDERVNIFHSWVARNHQLPQTVLFESKEEP